MKYSEQLKTEDWSKKRRSILERDNYSCQICNNKRYFDSYILGLAMGIEQKDNLFIGSVYGGFKLTITNIPLKKVESDKEYKVLFDYDQNVFTLKAICEVTEVDSNRYFNLIRDEVYINEFEINRNSWKHFFGLHVHHMGYHSRWKAWEYPDCLLVTLCEFCHRHSHWNRNTFFPEILKKNTPQS
ncbi:MAG: hypothetical protein SFY56_05195 [Bacteroidota bacterium]|nr:hypothetical protein [Bacteroidota bacterium]